MKKKRRLVPDIKMDGDCYQSAFNYTLANHGTLPGLVLVHGVCLIGVGPNEGLPFGHAWCEAPSQMFIPPDASEEFRKLAVSLSAANAFIECIDKSNGRDIRMPQALYYFGGRITQIHRYTAQEAARWALRTKHFGHWELEVDH